MVKRFFAFIMIVCLFAGSAFAQTHDDTKPWEVQQAAPFRSTYAPQGDIERIIDSNDVQSNMADGTPAPADRYYKPDGSGGTTWAAFENGLTRTVLYQDDAAVAQGNGDTFFRQFDLTRTCADGTLVELDLIRSTFIAVGSVDPPTGAMTVLESPMIRCEQIKALPVLAGTQLTRIQNQNADTPIWNTVAIKASRGNDSNGSGFSHTTWWLGRVDADTWAIGSRYATAASYTLMVNEFAFGRGPAGPPGTLAAVGDAATVTFGATGFATTAFVVPTGDALLMLHVTGGANQILSTTFNARFLTALPVVSTSSSTPAPTPGTLANCRQFQFHALTGNANAVCFGRAENSTLTVARFTGGPANVTVRLHRLQ